MAQLKNASQGDGFTNALKMLEELEINLNLQEMKVFSKEKYKKLVICQIKSQEF